MRTTIKQTLFAPALLLLAAMLGVAGCTNDDTFGRLPEGSIPLEVGEVTVAGMTTNTRAATTENAAGYTGIRKSRFVTGDKLELDLSNDGGITGSTVEATLSAEGAWVLNRKAYVIPGTTTIDATYRAAQQGTDVWRTDNLRATTYTLTGNKVTLGMKHENAMIDITLPAGVTVTSISVAAHHGTADETLATAVEEETDGNHYRTIALTGTTSNPGTVKSITAKIGGQSYVAILATPLTVEENKKYPIALTFKENKLTASVGAAALNWGDGGTTDIASAGYTRFIATPEDLAQFAKDVQDDAAGTGARAAIVLQTKDIDLSKLKLAADAGTNPMTNAAYTYTATAENWVPIGNGGYFKGKYNGNGHTISNMKITAESYGAGFFGGVENAALTGINLRNGSITKVADGGRNCGMLASDIKNTVVSLCSATGTIDVEGAGNPGGLIGQADASHITRCSANVKVSNTSYGLSTFIGELTNYSLVLGCSSTGDIMSKATTSANSRYGFTYGIGTVMGCYFGGATMDCTYFGATSNFNCYALEGTGSFGNASVGYSDCAYSGTSSSLTGVTDNATGTVAYNALTAGNASVADVKTLHWSKEDGYTLTEVTRTWYATDVWKDNGTAAPTIDMAYEGTPEPIVAGNTVWKVNGYWVTAPDTDASKGYTWDAANGASGPCANKGNWRVPTMTDFEKMAGWGTTNPWSQDGASTSEAIIASDKDAWNAAFPYGGYWSSVARTSDSTAWFMSSSGGGSASYYWNSKASSDYVRCVQVQ